MRKQRVAHKAGRFPRAECPLRREREPFRQRRLASRDFAQCNVQRRPHGKETRTAHSAVAATQRERHASRCVLLRHLANAKEVRWQ